MSPVDDSRPARTSRLRAALTVIGIAALLVAYVADSAHALQGEWWREIYKPFRSDGTMESVARGIGKRRVQSLRLGVAIRSLDGVREVVAPRDLDALTNVANELWKGRTTLALNPDVLESFAKGTWRQWAYDPHADADALARIKQGATVERWPGNIYVVHSPSAEDGRWILYTDSINRYIYIVPMRSAEEAGLR